MNVKYAAVALAALACAVPGVQAVPLEVINNSFELGPTFNQQPDAPTPPGSTFGWVYNQQLAGATAGQTLSTFFFDSPASDASPRHWFTNTDGTILFQETAHVIEAGMQYTLGAELGKRKEQVHPFDDINLQLWALDGANLTKVAENNVLNEEIPQGAFERFTTAYSDDGTHAGSTIVIQFEFYGGLQPALDVVTLDEDIATEPEGLPGDFNADGFVDAADYPVWRKFEGGADESVLNDNGDGQNGVDEGDYDLWVTNFGDTDSGASAAAPEPGSLALALLGGLTSLACARRRSLQ
jgi:hypothetical protein